MRTKQHFEEGDNENWELYCAGKEPHSLLEFRSRDDYAEKTYNHICVTWQNFQGNI